MNTNETAAASIHALEAAERYCQLVEEAKARRGAPDTKESRDAYDDAISAIYDAPERVFRHALLFEEEKKRQDATEVAVSADCLARIVGFHRAMSYHVRAIEDDSCAESTQPLGGPPWRPPRKIWLWELVKYGARNLRRQMSLAVAPAPTVIEPRELKVGTMQIHIRGSER